MGGGGEQQRNVGKVNRSKPSPSSLCKAWTYILVVNLRPKDGIKVEMKEGQIDKGNGEVGVGGSVGGDYLACVITRDIRRLVEQ